MTSQYDSGTRCTPVRTLLSEENNIVTGSRKKRSDYYGYGKGLSYDPIISRDGTSTLTQDDRSVRLFGSGYGCPGDCIKGGE